MGLGAGIAKGRGKGGGGGGIESASRETGPRSPAEDALDKSIVTGYKDGGCEPLIGPLTTIFIMWPSRPNDVARGWACRASRGGGGGGREAGLGSPAGDALDEGVITGHKDGAFEPLISPLTAIFIMSSWKPKNVAGG